MIPILTGWDVFELYQKLNKEEQNEFKKYLKWKETKHPWC